MEYNPFTKEYNRLKRILEEKNNKKISLSIELDWFDAVNIGKWYSMRENESDSKNRLRTTINDFEKEIKEILEKIHETKKHIGSMFNPFNWFDDEQKAYRNKLDELEKEFTLKKEINERRKIKLSETEQSINKINKDIEKYQSFDRRSVNDRINQVSQEINSLEGTFNKISKLKSKVDSDLLVVLSQIKEYEIKILAAKENIRKAQLLEKKLAIASNSYERAMIHQECDNSFGESSPKKIISQEERFIARCERDMEKTKKRASAIGEKAARDIKKIVIDGNNMCYEGSNFVGLPPLITLTNKLQNKYEVVVVFDSAIRAQLRANDKTIRAQFSANIRVHIVATKQLADETILEIASDNISSYILSNDRYGEYTEKEVIKNNRVIRHEIVDGKVMIHDLSVNIRYN